jgi:hypothetical protein
MALQTADCEWASGGDGDQDHSEIYSSAELVPRITLMVPDEVEESCTEISINFSARRAMLQYLAQIL